MGRFRSFFRRSAKPAAMVAVVGALSLSLVVTTPSNAYAFSEGDLIKAPPRIVADALGGIRAAAPAAVAAAGETAAVGSKFAFRFAGGPWVAAAMFLWDTHDAWFPFVAGLWGQASGGNGDVPAAAGGRTFPDFAMTGKTVTSTGVHIDMHYSGGDYHYGANASLVYRMQCTGGGFPDQNTWDLRGLAFGDGYLYARDVSVDFNCSNGQTLAGLTAGAPYAAPELDVPSNFSNPAPGPNNVYRVGNAVTGGIPAFNPLDPGASYKVTSQCIDSSGNTSSVTAESHGNDGALKVPSCGAAGLGHGTGAMTVTGLRPGGAPSEEKTLWDTPAVSDPQTPLCDPGRVTSGCELTVTKDGHPCTSGDPECEGWQEQSQKDDTQKARYGCKLGPYTLPLSACNLLAGAYRIGGVPATAENIDGDPSTNSNNDPNGRPVPTVAPPVTGTVPGGAGQPEPESKDEKARQCFPTGWAAFNPIEWVLKPLRCAFEPSANLQNMSTRWQTAARVKAPISFLTLEMVGPTHGGCPNWVVTVPGGFSKNVICDSSFTAAILSIRGPLFGLVATAMIWPLLRSLWYAAIPVLRVTPSSGGKE